MRQNILLLALSALNVASAQAQNFTINPTTVDASTRSDWCNAEYNTCDTLCAKDWTANDCDVNTLSYTCTCSNGSAPGLQYYTQTMPTFICEEAFKQCIAANTGSQRAQDECKDNIQSKCGTLDPSKAQVSQSSSAPTSTDGQASGSQTPTASQNAPSSSTSNAAAAATNAAYLGNGVAMVAAGVFAALL